MIDSDIAYLSAQLATYLAPFTPWLVRMSEGIADEAAGDAWRGAKAIWARLWPVVREDSRANEAVLELSAAPDDEDLRAQLRVQLRRLLSEDDDLTSSLAGLLKALPQPKVSVTGIVNRGDVRGGQQFGIVGEVHQGGQRRPRG
jgi:hypothetical protein